MDSDSRIPLSLVTGFLGSGKTTFIKRLAQRRSGRKIVYLVNEFSPLDVDTKLISEGNDTTVALPGGSIFCVCLLDEFVLQLAEIPFRFDHETAPIAGLLVESSGIADPRVVADLLAEHGLDSTYRLSTVVTVLEPDSFLSHVDQLPNIRAQVEAASVVLLNKVDLHGEARLAEAEAAVMEINPVAPVHRTQGGDVDLSLFDRDAIAERELHGEYAQCADPRYGRASVVFHEDVDLGLLTAELEGWGHELFRAKGFVRTVEGLVFVDWSPAGLQTDHQVERNGSTVSGLAMIYGIGDEPVAAGFQERVRQGAVYAS